MKTWPNRIGDMNSEPCHSLPRSMAEVMRNKAQNYLCWCTSKLKQQKYPRLFTDCAPATSPISEHKVKTLK